MNERINDSSPATCSLIVTDGDRVLCEACYGAGFCEQDQATHFYAEIYHGVCDSCGLEIKKANAGLSGGEAVRSDALLGHCVKCGERLSGHEDENRTHCRWCVTGWTPEDANTGQEAQVNERPNDKAQFSVERR